MNAVQFWLVDDLGVKKAFGVDVTMQVPKAPGEIVQPTFSIELDSAQELFEQLWAQGFRSAHDKGNAEALDTARKEHLADLRKAAKLI